jgi:2-keto-4-pentenoate hydratase
MKTLRPNETPESLAADPDVQAAIARQGRQPFEKPILFKAQLKETAAAVADAENTIQGLMARVELLENLVNKLQAENQELAREFRTVADFIHPSGFVSVHRNSDRAKK